LRDLDEPARHEAARRHARWLHQRPPLLAADYTCGFRRTNRRGVGARVEQLKNCALERFVVEVAARTPAGV